MKKMLILSRDLWNMQTKLAKAVLPYFAAALLFYDIFFAYSVM